MSKATQLQTHVIFYFVISTTATALEMQMIPGDNFLMMSSLSLQSHICSVSKFPCMKSQVNFAGRDACCITHTFTHFPKYSFPPSYQKLHHYILTNFEKYVFSLLSLQFSSVAQSCPTLCDPMNCSTPGLPVHHQLLEFTQTPVH